MQKKPGSLGRGLGALLSPHGSDEALSPTPQSLYRDPERRTPDRPASDQNSSSYTEHLSTVPEKFGAPQIRNEMPQQVHNQTIEQIPTSLLAPMVNQPRQNFVEDTLEELAASIRTYGILQPLIVAQDEHEGFVIIAGERRWRAAKAAGLPNVPCLVRRRDEHSQLEIALIENIQREELSAVDEARAYQRLLQEHGYSHDTLSGKIGKDRTTVSNSLRLLTLPPEILEDVQQKRLSAGHARAICALDEKKMQLRVRDMVLSKKLSVRQTEDLVKQLKKGKQDPKPLKDNLPPDLRHLCDQFKGHLGTKVRISGGNDRGKIEISYYTPDDLDRIAELVLGNPLAPRFES